MFNSVQFLHYLLQSFLILMICTELEITAGHQLFSEQKDNVTDKSTPCSAIMAASGMYGTSCAQTYI